MKHIVKGTKAVKETLKSHKNKSKHAKTKENRCIITTNNFRLLTKIRDNTPDNEKKFYELNDRFQPFSFTFQGIAATTYTQYLHIILDPNFTISYSDLPEEEKVLDDIKTGISIELLINAIQNEPQESMKMLLEERRLLVSIMPTKVKEEGLNAFYYDEKNLSLNWYIQTILLLNEYTSGIKDIVFSIMRSYIDRLHDHGKFLHHLLTIEYETRLIQPFSIVNSSLEDEIIKKQADFLMKTYNHSMKCATL